MLKKWTAAALLLGTSAAYAFMPQAGTWVMNDELNGKPGRGLSIDVQNNTLVMQMYAYESSGKPTFYLATGSVVDNQVSAELKHYEGGRYLGSGDRSGEEKGSAGLVRIRFVDGTNGFITFPGEPEKAITRFSFGYQPVPDSLKGAWFFTTYSPTLGWQVEIPEFTTTGPATDMGSGIVVSSNKRFVCEHQVRGDLAGTVICIKTLSGSTTPQHGYIFKYSVNDGEGDWTPYLGKTSYGFYPRRLGLPNGQLTGIVRKDEEAAPSPAALEDLAASLNEAALVLQQR
ncbi:hypothetical protein GCM10027082_34000 [Comamonas humi]